MARPVLFLLGMHAGGTSALAASLAQAGAAIGTTITPPIEEDGGAATCCARLAALSDEALRCMGITWDSPVALPDRWERNEALKALAPAAAAAVADEYPQGVAAVVADPRMCRLLPFWRAAFEQSGFAPSVVLALRRPYEVANALAKRAQFAPEKSLALWHHHVVDAERGSRGLSRTLITLDQWHADAAAVLQRIAADARFPLAASTAARDAAQKAAKKQKPCHEERSHVGMQSGLDTVLEAAYAKLAKLGPGVDPRKEIEAFATAARPALTAAIAPWLGAELDAARDTAVQLAAELATTQQRLADASTELAAMRALSPPDATLLVAQLEALREDRMRERALLIDELTKTRGEIVRMTTAVAEAPRTAEALRTELSQAHRDLYDERATISRLADEIESTRRDADGNAKRFDSARHHLEALAIELAETREQAQSREHDHAVIADEVDAWRAHVSDLGAERDKLLTERDHAMRQVTRLSTELDALRHERDGALADRESLDEAMRQSGQALAVLRDELPRRAAAESLVVRERDGLQIALKAAQERIGALESMLGERSAYIAELVQRHNALASRLNDLDKRSLVRAATWLGGKSRSGQGR